jgi:hypothetical protein
LDRVLEKTSAQVSFVENVDKSGDEMDHRCTGDFLLSPCEMRERLISLAKIYSVGHAHLRQNLSIVAC